MTLSLAPSRSLSPLVPAGFVLIWSTGFIGARFCLPHAGPLTLLALRFALAAFLLAVLAIVSQARWPHPRDWAGIMGAGLLVHGVYLGGVFEAIAHGLSAGVTALLVGMQPLVTAALAGWMFGERLRPRQWLGLVLGLGGVAMVVAEKMQSVGGAGLGFAFAALIGITIGTLVQKRYGGRADPRAGNSLQFLACAILYFLVAPLLETLEVDWTRDFVLGFLWLTVGLSVVGVSLFYRLIRSGAAARVASLMYLVPPVTALMGYVLFDERLGALALAGMSVVIVGVTLVNR